MGSNRAIPIDSGDKMFHVSLERALDWGKCHSSGTAVPQTVPNMGNGRHDPSFLGEEEEEDILHPISPPCPLTAPQ